MEKCGKYKNLDFVSELSDKIIFCLFSKIDIIKCIFTISLTRDYDYVLHKGNNENGQVGDFGRMRMILWGNSFVQLSLGTVRGFGVMQERTAGSFGRMDITESKEKKFHTKDSKLGLKGVVMGKIKPISHANFVKKLKQLGFIGPFSGGKHLFMSRGDFDFTIPNKHGNQDIGIVLLSRLLRQIGISIDEWNKIGK